MHGTGRDERLRDMTRNGLIFRWILAFAQSTSPFAVINVRRANSSTLRTLPS